MAGTVKRKTADGRDIFIPRLTPPDKSDGNYYSDKNPFYAYKDGRGERTLMMPNCTAYVYGRLMEITGKGFDGLIGGDAKTWYDKAGTAGLKTGKTPKLGAVCCWGVTDNGAGHISVVERIAANGDVVTSNSAYGGREFYLENLTKASGYTYAPTRIFQGFIYCGIEFASDDGISAGKEVNLVDTPCYKAETDAVSYEKKTGKFFVWDGTVINGRIRITNAVSRVGKPGQVSCWVNAADVGLLPGANQAAPRIKAGMRFELKNAAVYDSESGGSIGRRSGAYYVWSDETVNGRVRMTNSMERAGGAGQVSFWTDVSALK